MAIKKVKVLGKDLICQFCGNDSFSEVDIKLNERGYVLLDVEAFSKSGKAYICEKCGFKYEFIEN